MIPGLERWRDSAPTRAVVTKRVGDEFVCSCSSGGAVVVQGRGDTPNDAERDAASKLWLMALEAAGAPSDPAARYVKRAEPRRDPKKQK